MRINLNFSHLPYRFLPEGLFCCILVFFLQVPEAYGQNVGISDFTASNSESHLLAYLTVEGWFTEEMEAAVQNGIPITFSFSIKLFQKRSNWPDKTIRNHEFNHIIEYDSLKKEYIVHRHERGDSRIATSLEEARQIMSEIIDFKVIQLVELEPQASYQLKARAKLVRKTLPLYFHYLIPFSSPWDFETKWHELSLQLAF